MYAAATTASTRGRGAPLLVLLAAAGVLAAHDRAVGVEEADDERDVHRLQALVGEAALTEAAALLQRRQHAERVCGRGRA